MKKTFLLINKFNNTLIDEFVSRDDFPKDEIKNAIERFWENVSEVIIDEYKTEVSVLVTGKAITDETTIDFYLIQLT